jgi:phage gp36-like protein
MAYLTVDQYLERFGDAETIRVTNTTRPSGSIPAPEVDSAKVEDAISDASELVDGYIGKRYAMPLPSTPLMVRGWVAALAREQLHINTGKNTETVQAAADRARSQLVQLSKGDLSLPFPDGAEAPTSSSGTPISSGDRVLPLVTDCRLAGYLEPFLGGSDIPYEFRQ